MTRVNVCGAVETVEWNPPRKTSGSGERMDVPEPEGRHLEGLKMEGLKHRLRGLHMEMRHIHRTVEAREIYHRTPPLVTLEVTKRRL